MMWWPWMALGAAIGLAIVVVLTIALVWRYRAKGRHHRAKAHTPHPSPEAVEALRQAQRGLVDAARVDYAAQSIAAQLNATLARNHFAEAVENATRRKGTA